MGLRPGKFRDIQRFGLVVAIFEGRINVPEIPGHLEMP
jgi:hypothetical protein